MTESIKEPDGASSPPDSTSRRIRHFISRGGRPSVMAQVLFWGLLAAGLAADLWSKKAVFDRLPDQGDLLVVIDGLLNFVHAENSGAAFGICADQPLFLAAASIIALAFVLGYFYLWAAKQTLVHIALGVLAAGICGNLYDRLFNEGCVRDFIDVFITISGRERHWHTFNVADALLCMGVGLLIIWTGSMGKPDQRRAQQHK
jgi:signal peptidase II